MFSPNELATVARKAIREAEIPAGKNGALVVVATEHGAQAAIMANLGSVWTLSGVAFIQKDEDQKLQKGVAVEVKASW